MLLELRIENFAVIDALALRFEPGLTVLTGETGAGKSIIVGALGLLLGERASADVVRPGAARAVVEAVFDIADHDVVLARLREQGIDADEGLLILRREVAAEGRNRAWVNGAAATATLVGELGGLLVDLHGQHEHQTLLHGEAQRSILDAYAGAVDVAAALRDAFSAWRTADAELAAFEARSRAVAERADSLRFQAEEIEAARLEEDEERALADRVRRLEHAEELASLAAGLHDELYASERALAARLAAARRQLERMLRIDPAESSAAELLESAYYAIEEAGRRLGDYAASIEYDPGALEALRERQGVLFRLFRKYGQSSDEVIEAGRRARAELDTLEGGRLSRKQLERSAAEARSAVESLAERLSAARVEAAARLAETVSAMLPGLGLPEGSLVVALPALREIGPAGAEDVEYRVTLNRGFEPRPLARVASGGELSRVMLAIKAVLARLDAVPSLVFDEIDAGIGGRAANEVAATLRAVAADHQVFVITHLAQIAARADHHVRVDKAVSDGSAATRVVTLEGDARVAELARMLGADPESEANVERARELLDVR